MALLDDINRVLRDFERYTGDGRPGAPSAAPLPTGDPSSGAYNLRKGELRELLVTIAQTMGDPGALQSIIDDVAGKADATTVQALDDARSLSTAVTLTMTDPGAANPNTLTGTRPAVAAGIAEVDGSLSVIRTHYANTGPVTLNGKPLHDMANRPLEPGALRPNYRYFVRYSSFLNGYVLVTEGVRKADLAAIGSTEVIGVSPAVNEENTIPNRQWVAGRQYSAAGKVYAVELYAGAIGELEIAAFSVSGSNFVKGERRTLPITKTGLQTIFLSEELTLQPGERIGWWGSNGLIRATESNPDGMGGYYHNGTANVGRQESFPVPAAFAGVRFSINFRVRFGSETGALATALAAARAFKGGNTAESWPNTTSYVLVWAVGQSNGAGRGRTPSAFSIEAGRGYKYDPAGGIVHLSEPTGTDNLAQTNGYVSFGSGLAAGVLAATAGRVGVIVVNSCVGATTIADWGAGGPSWAGARAQIAAALAGAKSNRLNVIGAISVFCQGEGDTNSGGTPKTTYKAGVLDLLSRMRSEIGLPRLKMLMVQTGTTSAGDTSAAWNVIRQAQAELANESDGGIIMAHAGAKFFDTRGMMFDELHYTTQGYDEIGSALGAASSAYGIGLRPPALDT